MPEFNAVTKLNSEKHVISLLKQIDTEKSNELIGNILTKIAAATTECYQFLDLASLFEMTHEYFSTLQQKFAAQFLVGK